MVYFLWFLHEYYPYTNEKYDKIGINIIIIFILFAEIYSIAL